MAMSVEQLAASLVASGLVTQAQLDAYRAQSPPPDAKALARGLVKANVLSAYQAQEAYAGRARALVLGNYLVLDKLGQGGMGLVLKARHRRMDRVVALKVLSPAVVKSPEAVARFQREVEAAARLQHPHIVSAFDADEANGTHFLVMQYVDGQDLASVVKNQGPLSLERALDCLLQAARGLAFAHAQGVIHRDVKPANLLLGRDGIVKILDLGLARIEGDTGAQAALTGTGTVMGTVDYMAPEQAVSSKTADARADIYSLGMTLYFLLTGRPAYGGDSLVARLQAHARSPLPPLSAARAEVPEWLGALFQRMVAKRPEDRPGSLTEVIAVLLERSGGAAAAPPAGSAVSLAPAASESSRIEQLLGISGTAPPAAAAAGDSRAARRSAPTISMPGAGSPAGPSASSPRRSPPRGWLWGGGVVGAALLVLALLPRSREPVAPPGPSSPDLARPNPSPSGPVPAEPAPAVAAGGPAAAPLPPASPPATPGSAAPPQAAVADEAPADPADFDAQALKAASWRTPVSLGPGVNSPERELAPSLTADELVLVFSRGKQLFEARRSRRSEPFGIAQALGPALPGGNYDPELTMTADGLVILYSAPVAAASDLDIWQRSRASRSEPFGPAERLAAPVNTPAFDRSPVVSPDGLTLVVSSTRPGNSGGSDAYLFTRSRREEPFGEAQHLGPEVNRAGLVIPRGISDDRLRLVTVRMAQPPFEFFLHERANPQAPFDSGAPLGRGVIPPDGVGGPWFSPDGRRMYVHSRAWGGAGQLDLFVLERETRTVLQGLSVADLLTGPGAEWSPPELVVLPVAEPGGGPGATDPELAADGLELWTAIGGDLFVATRRDPGAPWETRVNPGAVLNQPDSFDQSPALSGDGKTLYFSSARRGLKAQLFRATRARPKGPFEPAEPLPAPVNFPLESATMPAVTPDELLVVFASSRAGTLGGLDLWQATRPAANAPFGNVQHLGREINSVMDEESPWISDDGLWIVYASLGKGHPDLVYARRGARTDPFGPPVSLGPVINSTGRERSPFLVPKDGLLLFESTRPGGPGKVNVWMSRRIRRGDAE